MSAHTSVRDQIPPCDFCQQAGVDKPAAYDAKTRYGPWANMCIRHFNQHGMYAMTDQPTGIGKGQRIMLRKPMEDA